MKKILLGIGVFFLTIILVGCSDGFGTFTNETLSLPTTTENNSEDTTINTITIPTIETTTVTIDMDMVVSEVYNMIYQDLYEDVKAEVISNISEERFDQIYAQILQDLIEDIAAGEITVSAETIVDMINNVEAGSANSVVGIRAYDSTGLALQIGSGVIYKHVGDKYYVVTNQHVVENAETLDIYFEDETTIQANLLGVDELVDIAVLSFLSTNTYEVSDFADSDAVQKGDVVLAVGSPEGFGFFGSMTMGIVSGLDRYFDIDGDGTKDMFVNYIQHDAAINSGNSGGALFDLNGDIIGINVIKITATDIEGMGFAIPSNLVSAICSDIEEYGVSLQKPFLGITFVALRNNIDYLEANGVIIPSGVEDGFYVFEVTTGGSFSDYVQAGDIIVSVGDFNLTTSEDFVFNFSKYKVGDIISISLYRNGTLITIDDIELKAKVFD
ncbi:S1C family serine protease [Candidatus Izemoplasma sp. B36]|uniref:S1C family serine protease n=1 Tax=Candidatus Izemoplasma sp. B36 TaxID=3242468 RepID=UPI0035587D1C